MIPIGMGREQAVWSGKASLTDQRGQRVELIRQYRRVDHERLGACTRLSGDVDLHWIACVLLRCAAHDYAIGLPDGACGEQYVGVQRDDAHASGDTQELGGLAQVRHFRRWLALRGVECLLVAVDPDDRDARLDARGYVGVMACRYVHPALLGAKAPRALDEVCRVGLVGADLLRGDDEVEIHRDVPACLAE